MEPITKVQFRKQKNEIVAVFPYEIYEAGTTETVCYAHNGQHSGCSSSINFFSKPAKPEEYKNLFEELTAIGYNLQVIKRRSHKEYLKAYYTTLNTTLRHLKTQTA